MTSKHRRRLTSTTLSVLATMAFPAGAQQGMSRSEASQLFGAAGYRIVADQPINRCGQPARPRVSFVDLNGDRQSEALFIDADSQCYAPTGRAFAVLVRDGGRWRVVIAGDGSIQAQATRTGGWLDMRVTSADCTRNYHHDGRRYVASGGCEGAAVAAAPAAPPAAAPPSPAPVPAQGAPTQLSADQTRAAFQAAGFKRRASQWRSDCDDPGTASYSPGEVERVADLNGDGLPEAVIVEGGSYCYGNTGQGYWLLSQRSDGRWQLMDRGTGIVEVLATKGHDGWPDLSIGGPGLCFPVLRWNGRAYKQQRWQYDGKPCRPPR